MIDTFELIAIINIVILIILLYFFIQLDRIKPGNRIHIYILLIAVIIGYFIAIFIHIEKWNLAIFFFPLYYPILFAIYPLIYLYIKRLVFTKKELQNKKQLVFFILPAVVFLLTLILFIPLSTQGKIDFISYELIDLNKYSTEYQVYQYFNLFSYYIQFIVFVYLLLKLLRDANKNMSDKIVVKNIVVQLIRVLIILIIAYEIILLILSVSFTREVYETAIHFTSLLLIVFLGVLGVNQSSIEIQTRLRKAKVKLDESDNENPKYVIEEEEKTEILQLIKKVLAQKKLYIDPNLKLEQFAKKIHVSPRKLSLVINEITGDNFNNFLNKYRIEEAKKLLLHTTDPVSIEKIYLRTGFNTRSTFNRAFKLFTGITPKEFKTDGPD